MDEQQLHGIAEAAAEVARIDPWEIAFLTGLLVGSIAVGVSRAIRDSDYSDRWQLFALGITTGFTSVACVVVVAHFAGGVIANWLLLVFVAITSAVVGKPIEQSMRKKLEKILGIDDSESDSE